MINPFVALTYAFGVTNVLEAGSTFSNGAKLLNEVVEARGGKSDETPFVMPPKNSWADAVAKVALAIKYDKLETLGKGESLVLRYYVSDPDNPRKSGYWKYTNFHGVVNNQFAGLNLEQFEGTTEELLKAAQEVAHKIP